MPLLSKATYISKRPYYRTHDHGSCHWSVIKYKSETVRNLVSTSPLQINLLYLIKKSRSALNSWRTQSAYGMKISCSEALHNGQQCFHIKVQIRKIQKNNVKCLQCILKISVKLRTVLVSSTRNTQSWWIKGKEETYSINP